METILELINYGLLLIFGTLLSMSFSGVENTRKSKQANIVSSSATNIAASIAVILLLLLVQIICWLFLGYDVTRKIYPLIIHIPLAIFITFYYKCGISIALFSVLSSYYCCQTPELFATIGLYLFNSRIAYSIIYSFTIFPVFYLIKKYVATYVHLLMALSLRAMILFGIVPLLYYLFDYATTVYTDMLLQGNEAMVLLVPSIVSILYFILIVIYYDEMQRRSIAENERLLLSLQIKQSEKELATYLESQEKTELYHHDMRHHFNLITGLLKNNDIHNAAEYIARTQSDIQEITPIRYCENNIVNLILSYFTNKAESFDITFSITANIPQSISIAETELCTLLSNGLENAFIACAQFADNNLRTVRFNCKVRKNNLLIFIENSYVGEVEFENGLPKSKKPGHGFGVRSMVMIIDKYKGYYSYTGENGIFTLRIALPFVKLNESKDNRKE